MLYVLVVFVYPLVFTAILTVLRWDFVNLPRFAGWSNYQAVFTDRVFWQSVVNTTYFTLISVPAIIVVSLALALCLQSSAALPLRNLFRSIFFIPLTTSLVAAALVWVLLLLPSYGMVNGVLRRLGLPGPMWLESVDTVIPTLAMIYVWVRTGFAMTILVAGLESIPRDYFDAARVDGAEGWQQLRFVTVPLLRPQLVLVGIMEVMFACQLFALPYAATLGGPANASRSVVMHIFITAFSFNRMGEASVVAVSLFSVILALTIVQRRLVTRSTEY